MPHPPLLPATNGASTPIHGNMAAAAAVCPSTPTHTSTAPGKPSPFDNITLLPTHKKNPSRPTRLFRTVRSAFRSFPILPHPSSCRMPHLPLPGFASSRQSVTGTLFGYRRSRLSLLFQEQPRSRPFLLLSLSSLTSRFLHDLRSSPLLRLSLECEKTPNQHHENDSTTPCRLLEQPMWSASINGKGIGPAVRREPTDADVRIMQLLHATSAGAGVLPADMADPVEGELTYMRSHFDRVVGSRDSETFYMTNPEGNGGPELTIFFVRI
ncbi:protein MIZU-KUSSEI 1-like protein [Carex littledalei]|uniref:Protein MIZU-KUSSEI 1-like protein n=1 Tax=Carex littledalei TaxID=544730 RepID=A0A833R085_9POAL|nr:protein MIZU-KUSSEI 1-like protein [Carex littledalei]